MATKPRASMHMSVDAKRRRSTVNAITGFQVELRDEKGRRQWMDYPPKAENTIRQGYIQGLNEVKVKLSVNGYVNSYQIRFNTMTQISLSTSKVRKIRPPYESMKYDAEGDDGIGEGLAGEDDEAVDPYEEVSKARLEMMPVVKEVKVDPKKKKSDQVKAKFEALKESPTGNALEELLAEAEEASDYAKFDKKLMEKIVQMHRVVVEVEKALDININKDQDIIPECIAACEKAGCGKFYIAGLRTLESQFKLGSARKIVARYLEQSRDVKGKTAEEYDEMLSMLRLVIDEVVKLGMGEEEIRCLRDRKRKIWNAKQDLNGNIRVYVRSRPLNQRELDSGGKAAVEFDTDGRTLRLWSEDDESTEFQCDATFNPGSQVEIFDEVRGLAQSVMDGYNVTIFAYGQTGSGKTYTMFGGAKKLEDAMKSPDAGVVIQMIKEIFALKKEDKVNDITVSLCMMELYMAKITDLLNHDAKAPTVNVRRKPDGETVYENAVWQTVKTADDLWWYVFGGFEARKVAATAMNSESSRSHLLLTMRVSIVNKATQVTINGKITMVDLAGSERVKDSGVEGHALQEAIEINKSLTVLGEVMSLLAAPKAGQNAGFKNNKLTEILQDSLGGSSKTLMFANVSPALINYGETMMTLKWAQKANKVQNVAKKASPASPGDASPKKKKSVKAHTRRVTMRT